LSEQFGAQMRYTFAASGSAGNEIISAILYSTYIKATSATTVPFARALLKDEFEFTESETTLGYAEARYVGEEQDVSESKFLNRGSRASRNFSAQVKLHNAPIRSQNNLSTLGETNKVWRYGFTDTDRLWFFFGTYEVPTRVHETTRLYWSASDYVEVSDAASALSITRNDPALFNLAYTSMQAGACLHNCLSQYFVTVFGNESVIGFDLDYALATMTATACTSELGARHNITGGLTSIIDQIDWASCIVTGVKVDWATGTSTLTYVTL